MTKRCSKCGRTRKIKFFGEDPRYRLGVKGWCKSCERAYGQTTSSRASAQKRYRDLMADPVRREKDRRARNKRRSSPEGRRRLKDLAYQRDYGISLGSFEKKVRRQKGRCKLCRRRRRLCADHDHLKNKFRGAICWPCNTLIGHIELSPGLLKKLFTYLGRVL